MNMLLNRKIKLLLGKSTICNGYGLFAEKRINKGQFIGEYKGELIWRGEEYIRSQICQAEKKTYLFPTNDEETIDGIMFGCKTRYINHSKKPNCSAVMLRSSGQDKIGIFAQACIYKQEELFLDYGKNIDSEFS
jgi:histone-lysine N-methyltransferase EZH2